MFWYKAKKFNIYTFEKILNLYKGSPCGPNFWFSNNKLLISKIYYVYLPIFSSIFSCSTTSKSLPLSFILSLISFSFHFHKERSSIHMYATVSFFISVLIDEDRSNFCFEINSIFLFLGCHLFLTSTIPCYFTFQITRFLNSIERFLFCRE